MRLGCDPEIFLKDRNGKHISAIGYIKAGKDNPLQIPDMPKGFTLQEDNVALEYGIPPASSADEFVAHIEAVMKKSREWFPKGLSFSKLSCTVFTEDQMQHPLAHIFGCDPDYCAWTGKVNGSPRPPHEFMRSAGGHVHVETDQDPLWVGQKMDLFLGVGSVLMDKGEERKKMYGKAGAIRKKPYGVEYRTLSNFWIAPGGTKKLRERLCRWVWNQTAEALAFTGDLSEDGEFIQRAINTNDKDLAKAICEHYNLKVI